MGNPNVIERTVTLPDGLITGHTLDQLRDNATIAILPDRVLDREAGAVAAFRPDTAALRAELRDAKLSVELAVPANAEIATYEEHSADWVLPVLLFIGNVPIGLVTTIVGNWISARLGTHSGDTTVRYREAHLSPNGAIDVVEVEGAGDEVARILRERGGSAEADGSES